MPLALRVLGLSVLALLSACDLGPPDRYEEFTLDGVGLRTVKVVAGMGDITIEGDPDAVEVTVVAGIHGDGTEPRHSRVGDVLELSQACDGWGTCAIDWKVVLPAATVALLETGSGDITVVGLAGDVHARTGSGDITLADIDARSVDVETGSGDVHGEGLRCAELRGETGSGELALELLARPRSVDLETGSGDATLTLPGGDYRLDLATGSGDIDLAGVRDDAGSDATLRVHTGSGDIVVAG
jgi:hypothetical protein